MNESRFKNREEYERWKNTGASGDPAAAEYQVGYIDQHLISGERVIYRARLHWAIFVIPGIICVLLVPGLLNPKVNSLLVLVLMSGACLPAYLAYRTSEFAVTSRRVIAKHGLIRRRSTEILLTKVEGITVDEGWLGRLLGYGTIVVNGTGGGRDLFRRINQPFEFRKKVQQQIESYGRQGS